MKMPVAPAVVGIWMRLTVSAFGQPAPSQVDDPEAYAVYATLLADHWLVRHARAVTLVIQRETTTMRESSFCRSLPSGGPLESDWWRPVVENYTAANAAAHDIVPGTGLGRPFVVVPSAEIRAIFKASMRAQGDGGWTEFHRLYPESRGFVEVSAVGFDAEKKRAMVYLAHHCGLLCGGGGHHFLEKVDGVWRKVQLHDVKQCIWMS